MYLQPLWNVQVFEAVVRGIQTHLNYHVESYVANAGIVIGKDCMSNRSVTCSIVPSRF